MRNARTTALSLAKALRRRMTVAEVLLWSYLRRNALGARFRKQFPVGPYVADFACASAKLIVEVDGATHCSDEQLRHDRLRDAFLRRNGWTIIRVTNDDVYRNMEGVLEYIIGALQSAPSGPSRSLGARYAPIR